MVLILVNWAREQMRKPSRWHSILPPFTVLSSVLPSVARKDSLSCPTNFPPPVPRPQSSPAPATTRPGYPCPKALR